MYNTQKRHRADYAVLRAITVPAGPDSIPMLMEMVMLALHYEQESSFEPSSSLVIKSPSPIRRTGTGRILRQPFFARRAVRSQYVMRRIIVRQTRDRPCALVVAVELGFATIGARAVRVPRASGERRHARRRRNGLAVMPIPVPSGLSSTARDWGGSTQGHGHRDGRLSTGFRSRHGDACLSRRHRCGGRRGGV